MIEFLVDHFDQYTDFLELREKPIKNELEICIIQ
jgi:hypothetical protein